MTIGAGVVGLGVGEQHVLGYHEHPDCRVRAICDLDSRKLAEVGARFPAIEQTTDPDAVLTRDDVDVVSIASYDDAHHRQILRALAHDKHVFVEKPLCLSLKEARDIRGALREKPHLLLSSNLILRKCPRFVWLRDAIAAGELGEIYYVEADYDYGRLWKITEGWRGSIPYYSVYAGGGVHMVDLVHWLLGDRTVGASAVGNQIASAGSQFCFPDLVVSSLTLASGAIAKISANFGAVRPHFHRLVVYGTKGTFENRPDCGLLYRSRQPDAEPERIMQAYPGVRKGGFLKRFVDAVQGQGEPDVSADEVFESMSVCFAVAKSLDTNQYEKVEYA